MCKEERFVWAHSSEGSSSWSDRPSALSPWQARSTARHRTSGEANDLAHGHKAKRKGEEAGALQLPTRPHFMKIRHSRDPAFDAWTLGSLTKLWHLPLFPCHTDSNGSKRLKNKTRGTLASCLLFINGTAGVILICRETIYFAICTTENCLENLQNTKGKHNLRIPNLDQNYTQKSVLHKQIIRTVFC